MRLFIRIVDGQPFEHPITLENFLQAFPDIDIDNLPSEFAEFHRILEPTTASPYEIVANHRYGWVGNVVKDIYDVRMMTDEEKTQKQIEVKNKWAAEGKFSSWIFNEEKCEFEPPVEYPNDGKKYKWDEETISWKEV